MKIKALSYGAFPRHNEVVTHYKEVEKINDYIYVRRYVDDGLHPEERFELFYNINGVYVELDNYHIRELESPNFIARETAKAKNYIENSKACARQNYYITLLVIRVFEELGLDTSDLLRSREAAIKAKEEERKAKAREAALREEERKRKEQENERLENIRLEEMKKQFLQGEIISGVDFETIARKDGLKIHIRTIATIRKNVLSVKRDGSMDITKDDPRKAWPKVNGVRKAIYDYLEMIEKPI